LLIPLAFYFTKLPEIKDGDDQASSKSIFHAFKHSHLSWGVAAQFFYVGAQVCVLSFFIVFASKTIPVGSPKDALIDIMESIFRFFHLLNENNSSNYVLLYSASAGFAFMIGRFVGTFFMKFVQPNILLTIYAAINVVLCFVAITSSGKIPVYSVIGIAFFMSIMFPTIFSLGIKDLGGDTKYGSSLIIMSIVGGAILPPVFSFIIDKTGNIQNSYIVPLVSFLVIMLFGLKGYKVKNVED
jgi:FHS family L-fucose permease-like MFS transporter